jgi:hypothetical protein
MGWRKINKIAARDARFKAYGVAEPDLPQASSCLDRDAARIDFRWMNLFIAKAAGTSECDVGHIDIIVRLTSFQ